MLVKLVAITLRNKGVPFQVENPRKMEEKLERTFALAVEAKDALSNKSLANEREE